MGKPRNKKRCKRRKNFSSHITVKLNLRDPWNVYDGLIFKTRKIDTKLLTSLFDDQKGLLFQIFTRENAEAFLQAHKTNPRVKNFMKTFSSYSTGVCERWKTFKIGHSLNKFVPKMNGQDIATQVRSSVSICQLRAYLNDVMKEVFTLDLLGQKNSQIFVKNFVRCCFDAHVGYPVFLQRDIMQGVRLSEVSFASELSPETADTLLQCALGFLCEFFVKIVFKTFFPIFDYREKIRFYRLEVSKGLYKHFLEKFFAEREAVMLRNFSSAAYYQLKFCPKPVSYRPIEQLNNPELLPAGTKESLKIANQAISSVCSSSIFAFGIKSLKQFAHLLRLFAHRAPNSSEFYCFSSDISSCYTAIKHDILSSILNELIPDQTFTCFMSAGKILKDNIEKEGGYLQQVPDLIKYELTKEKLLRIVKYYGMKNVIKHRDQYYQFRRGIPQGGSLSTLLCKIYLGHMEKNTFGNDVGMHLLGNGKALLVRYMDDYILISYDKQLAESIISKLLRGLNQYSLKLNDKKCYLTANLSHLKKVHSSLSEAKVLRIGERINWCGYAINTASLTLMIDTLRLRRPLLSLQYVNKSIKTLSREEAISRCIWIMNRIRYSLNSKMQAMAICRRNFIRPAQRHVGFNSLFTRVYGIYIQYFQQRLRIPPNSSPFKILLQDVRTFLKKAFKRRKRAIKR